MGWASASFRIDWAVWPSVSYRIAVESQSNHNHNTRDYSISATAERLYPRKFRLGEPEPRTLVRDMP